MQTSNAGLMNSASHAGLSNLVSYFKRGSKEPRILRGSEQLHVTRFARVWATPRFDWDTDMECCIYTVTRIPRPAWDLRFCYNWPSLLGQLSPHIMGELIPIMEGFWGTIIPLWLSRNSLSSYEGERLFELEQRELLEWTPNTKCVINRVPLC